MKKNNKCEICNSIITGRGAKRFCSIECRNKGHSLYFEEKRVDKPEGRPCNNPKCDNRVTKRRVHYCSNRCKRSDPRNRFVHLDCVECGKELIKSQKEFCSCKCRAVYNHRTNDNYKESRKRNFALANSHPNSLKARSETLKKFNAERIQFWKENPEEWEKHFRKMEEGKLNGGNKINKGCRSIPVTYIDRKGRTTNFKSILELKFAIQADLKGWDWEYERDILKEGDGHCIPDFWVENEECYYEVKPHAGEEYLIRYRLVADQNDVVIDLFTKEDIKIDLEIPRLNKGDIISFDRVYYEKVCSNT